MLCSFMLQHIGVVSKLPWLDIIGAQGAILTSVWSYVE